MAGSSSADHKLSVLCRRLGNLWSEVQAPDKDKVVSQDKLAEGKCTLYGRLFSPKNINYQAFFQTMKKAWKSESVIMSRQESNILAFKFGSEEEKNRIYENGPWSFASNLLVLKPWEPNKPPQSSKFDTLPFWIQIHGLPLEWCTPEMIKHATKDLGIIQDLKIEGKEDSFHRVGRAKINLNLSKPLCPGFGTELDGEKLWLDFKYERLPRFCYACGKIGHFTTKCQEFPYVEDKSEGKHAFRLGSWLKAEAREVSPYWTYYYEEEGHGIEQIAEEENEVVPETQNNQIACYEQIGNNRGKEVEVTGPQETELPTTKMCLVSNNSPYSNQNSALYVEKKLLKDSMESARKIHTSHTQIRKKLKRYQPYTPTYWGEAPFDESQLKETPVAFNTDAEWVLVACPKKPPAHK